MFLNVRDLEVRPQVFRREFPPGEIDLLDEGLRQASPLLVEGRAEYSPVLGEIRIAGHLKVDIEADCDRCLGVCQFPVDSDFRVSYLPAETHAVPEEAGLNEEEVEVAFFEGDGVDLIEVIREQVLLALPMQRICRDDCKGLCPTCGENWNLRECACQPVEADDRWSALRGWKTVK